MTSKNVYSVNNSKTGITTMYDMKKEMGEKEKNPMPDVVNRKNCIVVSFKKMGNDEQIQKLALLDSGNNLLYPAMATRLYEKLKDKRYISKDVQLKKTMMKANSVQGQKLKVKGILQIEMGSIWVSGI